MLSWTPGSPCGRRLYQSWCVIQSFTITLWYCYSLLDSWILPGIWTCTTPEVSDIFRACFSSWSPVDCVYPACVKVTYPELFFYPSQATLAVPHAQYGVKFLPPPSGMLPTYPFQATLFLSLYRGWNTLPWQCGSSQIFHKSKGGNKVESKSEILVGLDVFLCSTCHNCVCLDYKTSC